MGGKRGVNLSLRFNWPNFSKASGVANSLLEVSLWSVEHIHIGPFTHRRQVKLLWVRSAACLRHTHI